MADQQGTFQSWAVVELVGRKVIAGRVTEQTIAGQGFLKVDIPQVDPAMPAFSQFINPASVYRITPTDEQGARIAALNNRVEAIPLQLARIPARSTQIDYDEWGE